LKIVTKIGIKARYGMPGKGISPAPKEIEYDEDFI
jgi:hypothetical protein